MLFYFHTGNSPYIKETSMAAVLNSKFYTYPKSSTYLKIISRFYDYDSVTNLIIMFTWQKGYFIYIIVKNND